MTTFWYLSGIQYAMQIKILSKRYFRTFIIVFVVVGIARLSVSPIYADMLDPSTEILRAEYDSATCPQEMKECRSYIHDYAECESLSKDPAYYLLIRSPGTTVHYEKYCKKTTETVSPSITTQSPTPTKDIRTNTMRLTSYGTIMALSVPVIAFIVLLIRRFKFRK